MRAFSGRFFLVLLVAALWRHPFATAAFATDAEARYTDIILSRLPYPRSRAYRALHFLAGRPRTRPLGMTKSEIWSVPSDRVGRLLREAASRGVPSMRVEEGENRVLLQISSVVAMSGAQKEMMDRTMASPSAMSVHMMSLADPRTIEMAMTEGMSERPPPPSSIVIPLSEGMAVMAERTSVEKTQDGDGYVWRGVVKGTNDDATLIWRSSAGLAGTVTHGGRLFQIKDMGGGMHGVVEIAPEKMPADHAPMGLEKMREMNLREDPLVMRGDASMMRARPRHGAVESRQDRLRASAQDMPAPSTEPSEEEVVITVLVAYTQAAARHYADIAQDLIAFVIDDANHSFKMSRIDRVKLRLVYAYQTDYVEKGGHFDHVFAFADRGDGLIEEAHVMRDAHGADVAILIVHDPAGCGLAAKVAGGPDDAFAVVHHECAATMHSLAHEIGHIIGARHDVAIDDGKDPFPFGHGFVNGISWRTMMSYKESCGGCPRISIWSNPNVLIGGVAAGGADSNNARVIEKRALEVSRFR